MDYQDSHHVKLNPQAHLLHLDPVGHSQDHHLQRGLFSRTQWCTLQLSVLCAVLGMCPFHFFVSLGPWAWDWIRKHTLSYITTGEHVGGHDSHGQSYSLISSPLIAHLMAQLLKKHTLKCLLGSQNSCYSALLGAKMRAKMPS